MSFTFYRAAAALVVAALFSAAATTAAGADSAALEKKATLCFACHGPNGNSAAPAMPSIAGQPKQFITTQLVMFREGRRKDPQMSPVAATLSNADMNDVGTYFSAQKAAAPARKVDPAVGSPGTELEFAL